LIVWIISVTLWLLIQAHLLSSLVHSLLHTKSKSVNGDDGDDGCSDEQIVASIEVMLNSLVERMVKCEPEDFELVLLHMCLP